jgi:hypothetical protein
MSEFEEAARGRRAKSMDMGRSEAGARRVLVARSDGFFSSRYRLEIEEQDDEGRPVRMEASGRGDSQSQLEAVMLLVLGACALLVMRLAS